MAAWLVVPPDCFTCLFQRPGVPLAFFQSLGTFPDCGELLKMMKISLAGTLIISLRTSLHRHVARPQVHRRAVQTGGLKPFSTSLSTDAPNSACS